ncbi:MAG: hypothetical protein OXR73_29045, partial [Myxococcales bacterium]|nr:hypothetical protein [Myxococcales bacterium]
MTKWHAPIDRQDDGRFATRPQQGGVAGGGEEARRDRARKSPTRVMVVQVIGFAGLSVKEGI